VNQAYFPEALSTGEYRGSTLGTSLEDEGFIHCSRLEQRPAVVDRWYKDAPHIVVCEIDRQRVTSPVVDEVGNDGQTYPHIYGPLNMDAVIQTRKIVRSADGFHLDDL
jgi:uncharacterized protein (DUF952 family)